MIKNPFKSPEGEFKLKRNGFDLSENRLFTSDFGKIYPFFCKEVLPGDTFEIDSQIGLRGMPTVFPIQTRMRMSVEFYYCRNRCVYEDFEDFIFKTKDNLEMPWLKLNNARAKRMISTGSLGDAFRIPSTIGESGYKFSRTIPMELSVVSAKVPRVSLDAEITVADVMNRIDWFEKYPVHDPQILEDYSFSSFTYLRTMFNPLGFRIDDTTRVSIPAFSHTTSIVPLSVTHSFVYIFTPSDDGGFYHDCELCPFSVTDDGAVQSLAFSSSFIESFNSDPSNRLCFGTCAFYKDDSDYLLKCLSSSSSPAFNPFMSMVVAATSSSYVLDWQHPYFTNLISDVVVDATDDNFIGDNPFVGDTPELKINVLPFRHLEMIANYFYRNDKNNPYVLNGNVEYNKFIPSYAGGADENIYDFHYRNFELDQFTSAVQSPQFGLAPLVGLTYSPLGESATLKFQGTDAEGNPKEYTVTVGVDSDGIIDDIADFSKDIPSANLRKLQDQIQYGISINDLRVTNSFQRFLENTLRRGLRYRNQLKSHFGTTVDYPDIDVPQYIGGASGVIEPGQVTNTAQSPNAGLGDYVGTLSGGVSQKHKIHHYCPEHGYIIGVVSFYPIPMYCQNVDKTMIKHDAFDFYQPEFGKIGFVPVEYSELFPLQTPSGSDVHDVFGYQKAWYDYMRSYDSVHGDFRTTLRDFTLMRTFSERPQLSESFTTVHPEQFNDIFVSNNIADAYGSSAKFMLSSHVSCIVRRPMPVHGVPSLE